MHRKIFHIAGLLSSFYDFMHRGQVTFGDNAEHVHGSRQPVDIQISEGGSYVVPEFNSPAGQIEKRTGSNLLS